MAQERRKFNLSAALKPAQARENPYANDVVNQQLARLAYGVGANIAGRDAQRLTNQQTAAQGALASLLMTGSVPGATAASAPTPAPTGFLARAKQFAMPSAPTVAQAGRQFAGATQITPELLAASGADPFQVATAQRTIKAQNLALNQTRNLSAVRILLPKIEDGVDLTPQETSVLNSALQNLPPDISSLNRRVAIKDSTGKTIGNQTVDIFGRPVGDEKYRPVQKPGSSVTVQTAGETSLAKKSAEMGVQQVSDLAKQIQGNQEIFVRLETMEALLDSGMETGPITKALGPIKNILAELDWLTTEQARDFDNQQVFQAAASYIVPRMRVAGSGASSDFEQALFARATAQLANTPAANRVIIGGMKALQKHQKEVLKMQERYLQEKGNLLGFTESAEVYFKENPIFQKFETQAELAKAIKEEKIEIGELWFNKDDRQFEVLDETMMGELERAGLLQ
tara:strand:- start:2028 stop:3395 length:1368 start_codon:yes stop_codon:yes gene_type:complete